MYVLPPLRAFRNMCLKIAHGEEGKITNESEKPCNFPGKKERVRDGNVTQKARQPRICAQSSRQNFADCLCVTCPPHGALYASRCHKFVHTMNSATFLISKLEPLLSKLPYVQEVVTPFI